MGTCTSVGITRIFLGGREDSSKVSTRKEFKEICMPPRTRAGDYCR